MNILLLNDNPVVTKLVTLSAQKTSDELEIVDSIDEIQKDSYDLFVIDDNLYSQDTFDEFKSKIKFNKSLYICSRDANEIEDFTEILRKPFLPTDLVELFVTLGKEIVTDVEPQEESVAPQEIDEGELLDLGSDDLEELDELNDISVDDLDLHEELSDIGSLDEFEDTNTDDLDLDELDNISIEDLELDEMGLDTELSEDKLAESVLDKDELQEVQDLLEETSTEELDIAEESDEVDELEEFSNEELEQDEEVQESVEEINEEELDIAEESDEVDELEEFSNEEIELDEEVQEPVEEVNEEELDIAEESDEVDELEEFSNEELELDEEVNEEELDIAEESDEVENLEDLEEELNLDEEITAEELEIDEEVQEPEEELDLESQIESAVLELSDDDLATELDADTLLDIAVNDIEGLDAINANDIKLAIGEEVNTQVNAEEFDEASKSDEVESIQETNLDSGSNNNGVEALKTLLKALSNEDVVASLKGMKININITIGDN